MIATNEAVQVLRHGWQDAASTLAADVPEVAELLQARLEMAIATQRLNEHDLLETIQEVESVTSRAGSPSSTELARRLRRTVYEYLLALDAARPSETARTAVGQPATSPGSPMVGAEEVAALGHAARTRASDPAEVEETLVETFDASAVLEAAPPTTVPPHPAPASQSPADSEDEDAGAEADPSAAPATATRRRFALRRRQRATPVAGLTEAEYDDADLLSDAAEALGAIDDLDALDATVVDAEVPANGPPRFTPAGEPAVFEGDLGDAPPPPPPPDDLGPSAEAAAATDPVSDEAPASEVPADEAPAVEAPAAEAATAEVAADDVALTAEIAALTEPATEAELPDEHPADTAATAVEPVPDEEAATAGSGFVAPRAGFHIVEDAPAHRSAPPDELRIEMPAFSVDEPGAASTAEAAAVQEAPVEPMPTDPTGAEFVAWEGTPAPLEEAVPPPSVEDVAPQPRPAPVETPAVDDDSDAEQRGWGVRKPGQARSSRTGGSSAAPPIEDDPFEGNSKLSDLRRRIEDRLRRKRCDEAAALLQELAQETGGAPSPSWR